MTDSKTSFTDKDISMSEILETLQALYFYLLKQWWKILLVAIVGGGLGYFYAAKKPVKYIAKLSFIVEEGRTSGGGGLSALAGQFGFDVGGAGISLLSNDNLLIFLKSPSLVKETLRTPYDSVAGISLADAYADVYSLRETWLNGKYPIGQIHFPLNLNVKYTRTQDSLLHIMVNRIIETALIIEKPEKKATFITVELSTPDEKLSKIFCESLVNKAINRYVQAKTKRQRLNVDRLQMKADSIGVILNATTYTNASLQEKVLDVNPAYRSTTTNAEIKGRDKQMLTTIYGEVIKNLEMMKVQLSQETPTIQIVDTIELPLKVKRYSKVSFTFIFAFISSFILIIILCITYIIKSLKKTSLYDERK